VRVNPKVEHQTALLSTGEPCSLTMQTLAVHDAHRNNSLSAITDFFSNCPQVAKLGQADGRGLVCIIVTGFRGSTAGRTTTQLTMPLQRFHERILRRMSKSFAACWSSRTTGNTDVTGNVGRLASGRVASALRRSIRVPDMPESVHSSTSVTRNTFTPLEFFVVECVRDRSRRVCMDVDAWKPAWKHVASCN
jgi:hypothetical protein